MNLLFVSNLFPNPAEPTKGVFNAQQVAALAKLCHVKVIAPTTRAMPGEVRGGVTVAHPRFIRIPVLTRPLNGWLFARAIEPEIRRGGFDLVLASWAYPDAYGVMLLAKELGFPFVTDVLGSDVNVFFRNTGRKQQILETLRASRAVLAKSQALADLLATEGIKAEIDYNGIDHSLFHPRDRAAACRQLGLDPGRRRILYVGNLLPVKGPTILAQAFQLLCQSELCEASPPRPSVDLVFVGTGPEAQNIEATTRVQFVGNHSHDDIPWWMNASDVLCLPSLNEGLPNVALEALACGLPVVASRTGGVPEIVHDGRNGLLVPPAQPAPLAEALRQALATDWNSELISESVAAFDWDNNARRILTHLEAATNTNHTPLD